MLDNRKMKKDKIIYWTATGIIALMMSFSVYAYLTQESVSLGFRHLGFPGYFRIELAIAKFLGVVVLVVPQIPSRIKEWAYAGFAITFISANIAHINSGDPASVAIMPVIALVILVISYIYLHKMKTIAPVSAK
jgi:hypothetical protein